MSGQAQHVNEAWPNKEDGMPVLEGRVDHVVGVDTHRDSHTPAVVASTEPAQLQG